MGLFDTRALVSGFAGACVLTLLHEAQRRVVPDAPRLDLLGMRALRKTLHAADGESLFPAAIGGDLAANTAYYSLVGVSSRPLLTGGALGVAAGLGAVFLPGPLGLGEDATRQTPRTSALAVTLYTLGGLAAGAAYSVLTRENWPTADWGEIFFP